MDSVVPGVSTSLEGSQDEPGRCSLGRHLNTSFALRDLLDPLVYILYLVTLFILPLTPSGPVTQQPTLESPLTSFDYMISWILI